MIIKFLDNLLDERSDCASILTEITVENYLKLSSHAYNEQGKLAGQRDKLKTTSGVRIRNRMTEDFKTKAILPPVGGDPASAGRRHNANYRSIKQNDDVRIIGKAV